MPLDEPELLPQALFDLLRHGAVAPGGRLMAEPFQVALWRVPLGDLRLGEGVAQVRAEVELALLRGPVGVGDGLGAVPEQLRHPGRGLEVEVVVGPDVGEGPVDGGVAPGGHQRVLEAVAPRAMVEHVVGGDQRHDGLTGEPRQLPVAGGVAPQKVPLQLHVHRTRSVPLSVASEEFESLSPAAVPRQPRQRSAAAAGEQDHAVGVGGQVRGVQPGLPAVHGVGQGEEPRDVGVALPRPGQQRQAGAVRQGHLGPGDGPDAEAVGQARELQGAAQVGVGQRQGVVAVFPGPGQQLVGVGRPHPEGVEALRVQLHVFANHERTPAYGVCRYQRPPRWSRNRVTCRPSSALTR